MCCCLGALETYDNVFLFEKDPGIANVRNQSTGMFGHEIEKVNPVFRFMMQIAMFAGFAASYPVNRWLLRKKIKESM